MLKRFAFAHSLAVLCGGFYVAFYILAVVQRDVFRLLFNAQFFGADVAALLPQRLTYGGFLGTLLVLLAGSWIAGFAWAWLYNRLVAFGID